MQGYGGTIDIMHGELADIPADQPLIVEANHSYGISDGLVMSVMAKSGANFKIIANDIFNKARTIKDKILSITFKINRDAISLNLKARRNVLTYLSYDGAI